MIRVTVELISAIDNHHEVLGEALIYNDGTGTSTQGNYAAIFGRKGQTFEHIRATRKRGFKKAAIQGFPRTKLIGWDLLYRCLREAVGRRNP